MPIAIVGDPREGVSLRVGDTLFLKQSTQGVLPEDLKEKLEDHVIWLNYMLPQLVGDTYIGYAAGAIYAVNSLGPNLPSTTVLDLGAGEGTLSLVALKQGAKQAYLVDNEITLLTQASTNGILNGVGNKVQTICADLTDELEIQRRTPLDEVDVVIANIGPHETYGGQEGVVKSAVNLLRLTPKARYVVFGGFGPFDSDLSYLPTMKNFEKLGFVKNISVAQITALVDELQVYTQQICIIAEREI